MTFKNSNSSLTSARETLFDENTNLDGVSLTNDNENDSYKNSKEEEIDPKILTELIRVYYFIFLIPPIITMLLLSYNIFSKDVWRGSSYLGSYVLIGFIYAFLKLCDGLFIKYPSKFKKPLGKFIYYSILVIIVLYVYLTRFHFSANKLNWTIDTYFNHNNPVDPKNPPLFNKDDKELD